MKLFIFIWFYLAASSCGRNVEKEVLLSEPNKIFKLGPSTLEEDGLQDIYLFSNLGLSQEDWQKKLKIFNTKKVKYCPMAKGKRRLKFIAKKNQLGEIKISFLKKLYGGQTFIICFNDKEISSFTIKRAEPVLVEHNLGPGLWPLVPENRVFFTFIFAEEIFLGKKFKADFMQDNKALFSAQKTRLHKHKKALTVEVKAGQLKPGQGYAIFLQNISNQENEKTKNIKVNFLAGISYPSLSPKSAIKADFKNGAVKIAWSFNNPHWFRAEIYNDGKLVARKLGEAFSKKGQGIGKYESKISFNNLPENKFYKIKICSLDFQHNIICGFRYFNYRAFGK